MSNNSAEALIDPSQMLGNDSYVSFDVSGRDDSLLKILARKMNFKFKYVDIQSTFTSENATQPGELGLQMLQRRVGKIYLLLNLRISRKEFHIFVMLFYLFFV